MTHDAQILVVDDERETRKLLEEIMVKEGYQVHTAEDGLEAMALLRAHAIDVILSDIQMPSMDGLKLLERVREQCPHSQVILLTAYGSMNTAVEGIKAGAFDYISKPFVLDEVRGVVKRALEAPHVTQDPSITGQPSIEPVTLDQLQGKTPAMVGVYKLVARAAPSESTILIQGESGTGKELIARAIHTHSPRNQGPFVAVDCGTLAETLLESELFGHERGAFTGAVGSKKGLLEQAQGGTCFLDEIGDISLALQSKLLRVLQEREIRRVGGQESIEINVRIVAATNKNLNSLVKSGKFREDLYYRLNVVSIHLPALCERSEDIPLLVSYFLKKYGKTAGKQVSQVSPKALALLQQYEWPGNVRELEHIIERAIVLTPHSTIVPEDLPPYISAQSPIIDSKTDGWKTLAQLEREHILKVLEAFKKDEAKAAEVLGIHRKTLQRKLKEFGLR